MARELSSPSWFSLIMGRLGNYLIPDHIKRIMFIITVYHYMIDDLNNDHLEDLEDLSKAMDLAKTGSSALVFPGAFTASMWDSQTIDRILRTPSRSSRRLFKLIPCWLHYGRADDIAQDIFKLKQYVKTHTAT